MQDLKIFDNKLTMTLKEITDLLSVRHDRAFDKVSKMLDSEEFGTVSIQDIVYNDRGQTIKTYLLDKTQSIAVAAKLNTDLLVRVIKRWQELEEEKLYGNFNLPKTYKEALSQLLDTIEEKEILQEQAKLNKPKVEAFDKSKLIFNKKESVYDKERGFKKDINELYPFLRNDKITNILEYYTTLKYKDTNYYVKDEIEECINMFLDDCTRERSGSKKSVILFHDCFLGGKTVVNKELAIQYLGYTEEFFE